MTEKSGIYKIVHVSSGRVYVGSAANISKRWHAHRKNLRLGKHTNMHLQAAWEKYGELAFTFEILELTDDLQTREQRWMDDLNAYTDGFNLCPIARSSRNRVISEEEKQMRREMLNLHARPLALSSESIARRVSMRRKNRTLRQKLTCIKPVK